MINLNKIKPENVWYIIGLIATDGNLSRDGRHINITSKDREHLFLVRDALGLQSVIGKKASGTQKEKRYSVLQFSDVHFYRYLESIGLHSRKSLTLGKINVDPRYFNDFLRGVIDGDGCIRGWIHKGNNHPQWSLDVTSAAPIFIQWLKEEIENSMHIKGKLYTYTKKGKKNKINILNSENWPQKLFLKKLTMRELLPWIERC